MDAFKAALDIFMHTRNPEDMSRATNHFQRVSSKIKAVEEKIAMLGAPNLSLADNTN